MKNLAAGLTGKSRRPHSAPNKKIFEEQEQLVLILRHANNLGAHRIQNELKRQYQLSLSLATIHKILVKNNVRPLRRTKREKGGIVIGGRSPPGERMQIDTCKIE